MAQQLRVDLKEPFEFQYTEVCLVTVVGMVTIQRLEVLGADHGRGLPLGVGGDVHFHARVAVSTLTVQFEVDTARVRVTEKEV